MLFESFCQHGGPLPQDFLIFAVVYRLGGQQAQTGMFMLTVVPSEELPAETASIFDGTESIWELIVVLQGLELRFRVGIVIADMGTAVGFRYPEIGE